MQLGIVSFRPSSSLFVLFGHLRLFAAPFSRFHNDSRFHNEIEQESVDECRNAGLQESVTTQMNAWK